MSTSIEIPFIIVHNTRTGYTQIAPAQQYERLPAARPISPGLDFEPELTSWEHDPTNQADRDDLRELLEDVGRSVYRLLQGESLQSILDLRGQGNERTDWRRILVYTDRMSSQVPVEAMWSAEHFGGQPIGFVAANPLIPISIVRHLGQEATAPMPVHKEKPLRMLVVFSNARDQGLPLGETLEEDGYLDFTEYLADEKRALDDQLISLVGLNLLEVHFLAGDERDPDRSVVYRGRVQLRESQLLWTIETVHERDLRDLFLELLDSEEWHLLHYFGHGASDRNPGLVLRPGPNLSCLELGQRIAEMPRLVILNACDSANPAAANAPVLTGFATLFLLRGTVNLICMQRKVTPRTASQLTEKLYERLARSLFTRQMAFDEALYEVRQQVHDPNDPRLDFFCPVLYARPVNGPIFEYADDRVDVWRLIGRASSGGNLPRNPIALKRVMSLCSKTKQARLSR